MRLPRQGASNDWKTSKSNIKNSRFNLPSREQKQESVRTWLENMQPRCFKRYSVDIPSAIRLPVGQWLLASAKTGINDV
jgi:hypothetical protein